MCVDEVENHTKANFFFSQTLDKKEEQEEQEEKELDANEETYGSHDEESSTEYSDWEGPADTTDSSILKRREFTDMLPTWTAEEVKEAEAHYVYLEKAEAVLKASLQKASLAARRAAIFGFPEPSPYRDENEDEDDDDDDQDFRIIIGDDDDYQNDGDYGASSSNSQHKRKGKKDKKLSISRQKNKSNGRKKDKRK